MHESASITKIDTLTPKERLEIARKKLSVDQDKGLVPSLLNHLQMHENNRWLAYSDHLPNQIPRSHAAKAFSSLQTNALHYELIRICSFWEKLDFDSISIPTVVALAESPDVMHLVYEHHLGQYPVDEGRWREDRARLALCRLHYGIREAKEIAGSELLKHLRNHRDKLAHQLERTRLEKGGPPVPLPRFGDERKLLQKTVKIVNRLYMSISGIGFAWNESWSMSKRNARALWCGVSIEVLC
jgi:AbiU2